MWTSKQQPKDDAERRKVSSGRSHAGRTLAMMGLLSAVAFPALAQKNGGVRLLANSDRNLRRITFSATNATWNCSTPDKNPPDLIPAGLSNPLDFTVTNPAQEAVVRAEYRIANTNAVLPHQKVTLEIRYPANGTPTYTLKPMGTDTPNAAQAAWYNGMVNPNPQKDPHPILSAQMIGNGKAGFPFQAPGSVNHAGKAWMATSDTDGSISWRTVTVPASSPSAPVLSGWDAWKRLPDVTSGTPDDVHKRADSHPPVLVSQDGVQNMHILYSETTLPARRPIASDGSQQVKPYHTATAIVARRIETSSNTDTVKEKVTLYSDNGAARTVSFGAGDTPDQKGFFLAWNTTGDPNAILVRGFSYDQHPTSGQWPYATQGNVTLPMPAVSTGASWNAQLGIAVIPNTIDCSSTDNRYRIVLVLPHESGFYFGECTAGRNANNEFNVNVSSLKWQKVTMPTIATTGVRVERGADGRVYAAYMNSANTAGLLVRTGYNKNSQQITWASMTAPWGASTALACPPSSIYAFGPTSTQPNTEPSVPQLVLKTVALYRAPLLLSSAGTWSNPSALFGTARRRPLAKMPMTKKVLVGIIDGPPPIPNENINLADTFSQSSPYAGTTALAKSITEKSGITGQWAAGVSVKSEGDGTLTGGVAFEAELNASYTGTYEKQTSTTSTSTYANEVTAQTSTINGKNFLTVQPLGTVVLCGLNLCGYSYEMIGTDGLLLPGAPVFTQVWPMDVTITTRPYLMNPNGIIPGQLESYALTQEEKDHLNQLSAMNFADGSNINSHLTNSWGLSSTTVTSFETFESTSSSNGFSIDFKALVGGGAFGTDVLGGITGSTAWSWSTGKENQIGISTNVGTRGNISAPNSYTGYAYYTYHLKENAAFANDLLSDSATGIGLVTTTWPTDPKERAFNQAVKDSIATGSAPWKITYIVVDPIWNGDDDALPQNRDLSVSRQTPPVLPTALKQKLNGMGVKTPGQMYQLIGAKAQTTAKVRVSNGARPQNFDANQAAPLNVPAGLTPEEAKIVQDYVKGISDQHLQQYAQKHPNRVSRFKTALDNAKVMAAQKK